MTVTSATLPRTAIDALGLAYYVTQLCELHDGALATLLHKRNGTDLASSASEVSVNDAETFHEHRRALLLRAFRMLGDMNRAEEMLHEAWLRWQRRQVSVDVPRDFLLAMVTQICLDDLSARLRREHRERSAIRS